MRSPSRSTRRIRRSRLTPALAAGIAARSLSACSDATAPVSRGPDLRLESSEGRGYFQRYVAMGTSISAGVASDGLLAASQEQAWPAQLARLGHREISLPLVAWPGCPVPLRAPIASGRRIDGSSATSFSCAPNVEGVVLPANDVAVDGARVAEALFGPNAADAQRVAKHSRILPAGMTQVSAMQVQDPKLVSVEFGANELLGVSRGILVPNLTVVPFATFQAQYDQVLDAVAAENPKAAILVGLIDDVGAFPAFRTGAELWAQRAGLMNFGIVLTDACSAANAGNLVFVPVKLPTLAQMAAITGQPQFFACNDVPGTLDYVLTPGDRSAVNALLAQMNGHIAQRAQERGWAYFSLGEALYEAPGVRVPYNPIQQFLSTEAPYGSYISFDGYHPSTLGQTMIAQAAARALNAKYGMEIPLLMEEVIAGN
jgi:hypothetical protein